MVRPAASCTIEGAIPARRKSCCRQIQGVGTSVTGANLHSGNCVGLKPGFGVRPTWFARETGHGLYVTPFFRGVAVDGDSFAPSGIGFESGVFAGWAFSLSDTLDLRVGGGAQYIHFHVETAGEHRSTSTPFVALDAILGWRL